jgi:hypothetical protein
MGNSYAERARQQSFRWESSDPVPERFISVEKYCLRTDQAESTVRQKIAAGEIRAVTDGNVIRIPVSELSRIWQPVPVKDWALREPSTTPRVKPPGRTKTNGAQED